MPSRAAASHLSRPAICREKSLSDDKDHDDTLNSENARRFPQLDCQTFERLGRYETALWRQVYLLIFVLNVFRRQNLDRSWLPRSSSSTRLRAFESLLLPKSLI